MHAPLNGLLPVLQLPYCDDDTIDWDVLWHEVDWLFEHGSDGLVVAMVTEVLRLSESERRTLTERICGYSNNLGPVVISVGSESCKTTVELAQHAEGHGAAAVMAIPPIATVCLETELRSYYQNLINAISIPVIVQDASGYVGRPLSIEFQADLLKEHGPRVMFKPEAPPLGQQLSALRDATEGKAAIFEGSGGIALIDSHRRGIVGTMPGADLIRIVGALWRYLQKGDQEAVWRIGTAVSPLLSIPTNLDSFLAIEKHLLIRQGVFKNSRVRGPVGYHLDSETRIEIDRLFDRALEVSSQVESRTAAKTAVFES